MKLNEQIKMSQFKNVEPRHILANPLTSTFFNLNFHQLDFVSRWRDPQIQVTENY